MTTEPKKPRAKRRNFERAFSDLKQYCEVKRDILALLSESAEKEHVDMMIGQVAAFNDVLARMEK